MLSQDGFTLWSVTDGGGEVTTKDVVAEEKILEGTTDGVARATDSHRLHHTYNKKRSIEQITESNYIIGNDDGA